MATKISIPDYVQSKEIKINHYGVKISKEEREAVEKSRKTNYAFKLAKSDKNCSQDLLNSLSQIRKEARKEAKKIQQQHKQTTSQPLWDQ